MIEHAKRRGEWVELQFMARAAGHGLTVSKPWGDSARYDFAVEHHGRFSRVQVKSTLHYIRNHYMCHCAPPNRYGGYSRDEIDFVAAFIIPEDVWYILPVEVVSRLKLAISLAPHRKDHKYTKYIEAWHLLRGNTENSNRSMTR